MSKNTTHFVLRIKDNMQCKEGIFNDALGEFNWEEILPTQLTTEIKIAALCCRARLSGKSKRS